METREIIETGIVLTSVVVIYTNLYNSAVTDADLYILGYFVCACCIVFLHQIAPLLIRKDAERRINHHIYRSGSDSGIWTCLLLPLSLTLDRDPDVEVDTTSYYCCLFTVAIALLCYNPSHQTQIVVGLMFLWFRKYSLQQDVYVLVVSIIFSVLFYFLIIRIPHLFKKSFTEGETAVDAQILTYILTKITVCAFKDETRQNLTQNKSISIALIAFEAVFITSLLLCISKVKNNPLQFYLIYGIVNLVFVLPLCLYVLGPNPVVILYQFITESHCRIYLLVFWTFLVLVSLATVYTYSRGHYPSRQVSTRTRKYFHLLIVVVYISGLYYDPPLLYTASVVALDVLVIVETIRIYNVPPFGEVINHSYTVFIDKQDKGRVILTPIYLLVGISLPLWITQHSLEGSSLSLYAGVLSIGIGDTTASVFGSLFGTHKWPGCSKTIEGTVSSIILQFFTIIILQQMGQLFFYNVI